MAIQRDTDHRDNEIETLRGKEACTRSSSDALLHIRSSDDVASPMLVLSGKGASERKRRRPVMQPLPQSAILSRVMAFLPAMAAANENLTSVSKQRDDFVLEKVEGEGEEEGGILSVEEESEAEATSTDPYIEMDLGLGVVDLRTAAAVVRAERAMRGEDLSRDEQPDFSEEDDVGLGNGERPTEGEDGESFLADSRRRQPAVKGEGIGKNTEKGGKRKKVVSKRRPKIVIL
eukprot:TRINITY_DN23796_c0_g1_i1.p1 TRINITY_DN23796_c0_g1~~TRINITY_DN23796_c0_g1_i1.p1  ORF type:complete len:232 (+),score=49.21 TRINITY_DN23796_c0_g1_i1:139-834(+)